MRGFGETEAINIPLERCLHHHMTDAYTIYYKRRHRPECCAQVIIIYYNMLHCYLLYYSLRQDSPVSEHEQADIT